VRLLYGNYEVSIDDKNRMLVPAEIRRAIDPETDGEAFFLVPGVNGRPWLYPERPYEQFALRSVSEIAPEEDLLAFDMVNFAMATRLEWDKQGRILIPEKVLRKSGLGREVTVLGVKDHVEIWNRSDWEQQEQELDRTRPEIAMRGRQKFGMQTARTQAGPGERA
jgi:MraZ protein